jgi:predicted nucleotidyltransferase
MLSDTDVAWIVSQVADLCRPTHVYMFGSYVTGGAHARSDLDLLVVQHSRLPRHRRGAGVKGRLRSIAVDLDLVFVTPEELREELKQRTSLLSAIMPSARLVYQAGGR